MFSLVILLNRSILTSIAYLPIWVSHCLCRYCVFLCEEKTVLFVVLHLWRDPFKKRRMRSALGSEEMRFSRGFGFGAGASGDLVRNNALRVADDSF